ncbi:hypothetical protein NG798_24385 [Ancylothrix sp. C2]|uniref:hypothetical protein n=1 Tax=Ancylothrix sp. D3o TaxID=2953691 RepID=UPI0021BB5690|nr:hypothetical protein [Ancylothrix sp. D3o]MCT7952940.1 hypothetical protein [Ancylothrix sp. D3o]
MILTDTNNSSIPVFSFAFPNGTPKALITEALESLPLLTQLLLTNLNVLELNVIDTLLDLKEKLGNKLFSKFLQSQYPLTAKEITQKLGMAELKQNLENAGLLNPTILDLLLQIGTEGCAALAKGSAELAVTLINQVFKVAGVTIPTLRALVKRENKGFNPFPTAEEIAIYQPATLVTITKKGKFKNLVAEVIETPDIFGRVQVRLVKTNAKKTFFLWEIELHQLITPDVEEEVPPAFIPPIINQFVLQDRDGEYGCLSDNDMANIREEAESCALQDADEDTGTLAIKWKHLLETVERYNLVPVESVLEIQTNVTPAPPSQKLLKQIAWARDRVAGLQRQIDECAGLGWKSEEKMKQERLHAQLHLDKALKVLCSGQPIEAPVDEPTSEIIVQLESERDSLLNEIEQLKNQLSHLDTPAPTDGIGPMDLPGSGDAIGPVDVEGPVDHLQEPAREIITKLESERNNLLEEINSLHARLQTNSISKPSITEYQFEPVSKVEDFQVGDCIRINAPDEGLQFGDIVVEVTEFGAIKTQWFGALGNSDFKLGWKFEKVLHPLQHLTVLPPPQPVSEEWKKLDGPLYEILEMVDTRGGVRLEPVKGCKILQHPTSSDQWYRFLTPSGQKLSKLSIDGEWVKEQSLTDCELDF